MARFPTSISNELGTAGVRSWNGLLETYEQTPELRWPQNVPIYDAMRRSDAQVAGVMRAIKLPVRRTEWRLDGAGCDPNVVAFVESELGLQDRHGRRRRRRQGISWDEFLSHALLHLDFGHMFFEQVYEIGPPPPDIPGLPAQVAHLRKLAPRLPITLIGIDVAWDGGLTGIRQIVFAPDKPGHVAVIPVDRLVAFTHEREGSDWSGQSLLRSAYKHSMIRDQLLRIGAMAVERNSMGVPVVYYGEEGDRASALKIGQDFRAGEQAAVAARDGVYKIELLGITGTTKDELPAVKYHDEQIGRSALLMFLNLGHDNGARSLGQSFIDYFLLAEGALIAYLEETITEHVVRDLVELNFGPDEAYPLVVADEVTSDAVPEAVALKDLVEAHLLTPDRELEAVVRRGYGLPEATPEGPMPAPPIPPASGDQPVAPDGATVGGGGGGGMMPDVAPGGALSELRARLAAAQQRLAALDEAS